MLARDYHEDGIHILRVEGEIDLASSPELRVLLMAHAKARRRSLLLDFSEVKYVDSSALATLIEYVRKARDFGGRFALAQVSARVHTVFQLARLHEFLSIYPTLAEAKAALSAPSPPA